LGVDQFLQDASRYEDLALSVPWLSKLRDKYPKWGTSLLWVHDKSLSDKALQNFAADMHALGKDALVNEVRQVQSQVAVLNVSYGRLVVGPARSAYDFVALRVSHGPP